MWEQRGRYPVSMMARLLGVSRPGHCSWLDAGGHADPLAGLKDVVEALREGSGGTFGWRRVKAELPPEWSGSSGYSVLKSMRELGISGHAPRSRKRTTVPDPDAPARPDLVRRRFRPPVPTTVLCGDITSPQRRLPGNPGCGVPAAGGARRAAVSHRGDRRALRSPSCRSETSRSHRL